MPSFKPAIRRTLRHPIGLPERCSAGAPVRLAGSGLIGHHALVQQDPSRFDDALTAALARWDMPIEPDQLRGLASHYLAMIEKNRTTNLTRITEPDHAAVKHYADSLALVKWARERDLAIRTVLDIGTGAGFPAVPLAVMCPNWSVSAIDATGKKIDFLRETVTAMGLRNLRCEHGHSAHWCPDRLFDLVTFRALVALPQALEQATRHLAAKGLVVAYKTAVVNPAESRLAGQSAAKLGLQLDQRYEYDLVIGNEQIKRILYVYRRAY